MPRSSIPALAIPSRALLEERARFMRFHPTPPEAALWQHLRGRRLGVTFRRQVVLGLAIVDFFAAERALVVEVDGEACHATRTAADARRDEKLTRPGYRVLRLPASLVLGRVEEAVARVREWVNHMGGRPR